MVAADQEGAAKREAVATSSVTPATRSARGSQLGPSSQRVADAPSDPWPSPALLDAVVTAYASPVTLLLGGMTAQHRAVQDAFHALMRVRMIRPPDRASRRTLVQRVRAAIRSRGAEVSQIERDVLQVARALVARRGMAPDAALRETQRELSTCLLDSDAGTLHFLNLI